MVGFVLLVAFVLVSISSWGSSDDEVGIYEILILDDKGDDVKVLRGITHVNSSGGLTIAKDLDNNEYRLTGNIKIRRLDGENR